MIVLKSDQVIYSVNLMVNTRSLDEAITKFFNDEFGMSIGKLTAKTIRTELGGAFPQAPQINIRGRQITGRKIKDVMVSDVQIREAIADSVNKIVSGIGAALGQVPVEMRSVIAENGVLLRGEGSKIRGLDRMLSSETGLAVTVAQESSRREKG